MRRALVSLTLAFAAAFAGPGATPETGWPGYVRMEVQSALKKIKPHPRLLAETADFDRVRASTNELVRLGRDRLFFEADQMRRFPLPMRKLEGRRLLTVSQRTLSRILTLSFAYRLSHDERYAARALAEAEAVCAFKDWNPTHFLDTAEMTLAVAIAYDWLFDAATPEQRANLRKGLLKNGLRDSNGKLKTGGWVMASNNWGQVCHAGLAAGAIALMDEEPRLAEEILVRSATYLPISMKAFAPAGGFPEGPGAYWPYAMSFNVVALESLTKALGTDLGMTRLPGFRESADYLDSVTGPTGLLFNYADAAIVSDQKSMAKRAPESASFWLAHRFNRADTLDRFEIPLFRAYCKDRTPLNPTPRRVFRRLLPLSLLWIDETAKTAAQAIPPCRQIPGPVPIAAMRTGWNREDWFVGLKGGSPSSPHGHMDGGSFVFDAKGVRWASDLGSEDYNRMETTGKNLWDKEQDSDRWKIFRLGAASHNIFRLNGEQQQVNGKAVFSATTNEPLYRAEMDLKTLYKGVETATRTATLMPGGGFFVLHDKLSGLAPGTVLRWQMVTPARVKSNEENVLVLVQRGPDGEDVEMELKVSDRYARWETESLDAPMEPDESPNPGFTLLSFKQLANDKGELDYSVQFK